MAGRGRPHLCIENLSAPRPRAPSVVGEPLRVAGLKAGGERLHSRQRAAASFYRRLAWALRPTGWTRTLYPRVTAEQAADVVLPHGERHPT